MLMSAQRQKDQTYPISYIHVFVHKMLYLQKKIYNILYLIAKSTKYKEHSKDKYTVLSTVVVIDWAPTYLLKSYVYSLYFKYILFYD